MLENAIARYHQRIELVDNLRPWDKWKKPWTKEQCRRRYVEGGDRISLRALADASERGRATIQRWSAEETKGENWNAQRASFESSVGTVAREKTIEKTSDKLSEQLSDIAIANYQSLKLLRDYATFRIQLIARDASVIQKLSPEEQLLAAKGSVDNHTLDTLSKVLQRAIAGINETVGLKYHVDINAAIEKAVREGYLVVDPNGQED